MTKASFPLLIFCFDAGDSELISQWAAQGHLPTLTSIIKRGCWKTISGSHQVDEHGCWLSLLSGIPIHEHGYYYFRQLRNGTYDLYRTNWLEAKATPFWSELNKTNKKVAIIDPPEGTILRGLSGIQLADWASHQTTFSFLSPSSEPDSLLQEVCSKFGIPKRMLEFKLDSAVSEDYPIYQQLLARAKKKGELCRHLISSSSFDLMVVGFSEPHVAAHRFWKYLSATETKDKTPKRIELQNAIRSIYAEVDHQLGLLLKELPKDINIFVTSPYGMKSQYPITGLMDTFCQSLGYQVAPQAQSGGRVSYNPLSLLRQILPAQLRVKLSSYLPEKIQEQLYQDFFRNNTDWGKTKAFSIPSLYTGMIRVNLKGREPSGIVKAEEYKELLDELEQDLNQLTDPMSDQLPIIGVTRIVDSFSCDLTTSLPDMFVEWKPSSHFIERIYHPKAELRQQPQAYNRDSYHSMKGFVAAAGPSIKGNEKIENVSLLDLSPTFLSLLNTIVPSNLKGKPIKL